MNDKFSIFLCYTFMDQSPGTLLKYRFNLWPNLWVVKYKYIFNTNEVEKMWPKYRPPKNLSQGIHLKKNLNSQIINYQEK